MRDYSAIYSLPVNPAVYAFYSGGRGQRYVAYVGIAGQLKRRIGQHLIRRDSSVATGTSAVNLNPDYVDSMSWWEHESFDKTASLKAAEMIAFDILNPALRSRAGADSAGDSLLSDSQFKRKMEELFKGPPTGTIEFPSLSEIVSRISQIEDRLKRLESKMEKLKTS